YSVGLAKTRTTVNDTKATLYAFVPTPGQTPDQWTTGELISGSTVYPNAGAPAPVKSTSLPVNTGAAGDKSLATVASDIPQASNAAGYANTYEIRMTTNAPGHTASTTYDYADITINTATNTWTEVYSPDQAGTATSSTLTASNTSPNTAQTVTLTDTVAPAAATGTVQFVDGTTNIGTPVTVTGGVATSPAMTFTAGPHHVTAVYSPQALSGYTASTSNNVDITATQVVTNTTTAVAHAFGTYTPNPDSSVPAYTPTTLTATVTPSTGPSSAVAGSVQFFDNSAAIGSATVSGGTATLANYAYFGPGAHSITATFTPSNSATFGPSTSAADTFTLGAAAGPPPPAPDKQYITVDVPNGALMIMTPYSSLSTALNVGNLVLNAAGTALVGSAPFGSTTGNGTDPLANTIKIVDTRTGGLNWQASALSTQLTQGTNTAGGISAENVGLTNLVADPITGNHLTAANTATFANPAADPAVALSDTGVQGLGGPTAHKIATSTDPVNGGTGTIGFTGTLTVTAPTSIAPGHYVGTITFTVA
ncbi:MAG: Ig-like domain-containing protein, partial [Actinomycetota bacterium]|nr:Ig-like domain-containing protein [Actinomycetota bacterium]